MKLTLRWLLGNLCLLRHCFRLNSRWLLVFYRLLISHLLLVSGHLLLIFHLLLVGHLALPFRFLLTGKSAGFSFFLCPLPGLLLFRL